MVAGIHALFPPRSWQLKARVPPFRFILHIYLEMNVKPGIGICELAGTDTFKTPLY